MNNYVLANMILIGSAVLIRRIVMGKAIKIPTGGHKWEITNRGSITPKEISISQQFEYPLRNETKGTRIPHKTPY